jgi:hypothetical protein
MLAPLARPLALGLTLPLVNALAGGAPPVPPSPPFAPTSLTGLSFWYDMTLSTLTDVGGGVISDVSDLSGNANHGTQPGANRAVKLTNHFGSLSALDMTADFYDCGADVVTGAGTYFVVARPDTTHLGSMVGIGASSNAVSGACLRTLIGGTVQMIIGNGTARDQVDLSGIYSAGQVICCIGRWDGTTIDLNVNGTAAPQSTHSLGSSFGSSATQFGALVSGASPFDGKIGAAGRYSRRLSAAEVVSLMIYLMERFGA